MSGNRPDKMAAITPRDLFGLGLRLFGVWLFCRGLPYLASFIDTKLYPASEKAKDGAAALLIYAIIDFSIAAFFLLWTRVLIDWSYGEAETRPTGEGLKSSVHDDL